LVVNDSVLIRDFVWYVSYTITIIVCSVVVTPIVPCGAVIPEVGVKRRRAVIIDF